MLTAFLAQRCANAVAPTGGPKDETPPKVVGTVPENHSINFIGKKIEITFDEYVSLENANQNVMISPPLSEKPDIKLKNKTVIIKFKETLASNTTYTINFGAAIKDFRPATTSTRSKLQENCSPPRISGPLKVLTFRSMPPTATTLIRCL